MNKNIALTLLALTAASSNSYALNFADVCDNQGNTDCSAALATALSTAANTGEEIYFPAGDYKIETFDNLSAYQNITLRGAGQSSTKIHSKYLWLTKINNISIKELTIEGINPEEQRGEVLLRFGQRYGTATSKLNSVTVENVTVRNASAGLLLIDNVQCTSCDANGNGINISGSTFEESGRGHVPLADGREAGVGIQIVYSANGKIDNNQFNAIRQMGLQPDHVQNFEITNNTFDLALNDEYSNKYGEIGGSCIYVSQATDNSNINIEGNECKNFANTGIRLNGTNVNARNNYFNHIKNNDSCNTENFSPKATAVTRYPTAIKAHYLQNSQISDNCINHSNNGILLQAWNGYSGMDIYDIDVNDNYIRGGQFGIQAISGDGSNGSSSANASYGHVTLDRNIIRRTTTHAIAMRAYNSAYPASNNSIWTSTLSNDYDLPWYSAIRVDNQQNAMVKNNWILGRTSINYRHIHITKTISSNIDRNTLIGVSTNAIAGGIKLEAGANYNYVVNNTFTNMNSSNLENNGSGNTVSNNTFN